jgi:hypothetical protein
MRPSNEFIRCGFIAALLCIPGASRHRQGDSGVIEATQPTERYSDLSRLTAPARIRTLERGLRVGSTEHQEGDIFFGIM